MQSHLHLMLQIGACSYGARGARRNTVALQRKDAGGELMTVSRTTWQILQRGNVTCMSRPMLSLNEAACAVGWAGEACQGCELCDGAAVNWQGEHSRCPRLQSPTPPLRKRADSARASAAAAAESRDGKGQQNSWRARGFAAASHKQYANCDSTTMTCSAGSSEAAPPSTSSACVFTSRSSA
jgi:hypothetical protein